MESHCIQDAQIQKVRTLVLEYFQLKNRAAREATLSTPFPSTTPPRYKLLEVKYDETSASVVIEYLLGRARYCFYIPITFVQEVSAWVLFVSDWLQLE